MRGRDAGAAPHLCRCMVIRCPVCCLRGTSLPPLSPPPLSAPAGAERGARIWLPRAGYAFLAREVAVRFFVPVSVNWLS